MTDWEEFQEIPRDEVPLHYNIYRTETEYVNHPQGRFGYATLKIVEGDNLLWWKGRKDVRESDLMKQIRGERAAGTAVVYWHYRKIKKILCPFTKVWSTVDPALLI